MMPVLIGDLQVFKVYEQEMELQHDAGFLDGLLPQELMRHMAWLAPDYCNPENGALRLGVHSWLIRTGRLNVLVDTCFGNDKNRPFLAVGHQQKHPYLERLAVHGVQPEDIDIVMCTHLHVDHVGWNTRLINGRWVPSFPNARYIMSRAELEFWDSRDGSAHGIAINENVFEDSVLPVVEAGQAVLVDDGYDIDHALRVEMAIGHSPGHMILRATSNGATGIFSGDVVHHPVQIACPHVNSAACQNAELARQTRFNLLEYCADEACLLLPAHFTGLGYGRIARAEARTFQFLAGAG